MKNYDKNPTPYKLIKLNNKYNVGDHNPGIDDGEPPAYVQNIEGSGYEWLNN